MSELAGAEGLGSELLEEPAGVAETALPAAEGIYHAATGDWAGAADSALDMSASALETTAALATGGLSELAGAGWDNAVEGTGLPAAHDALHDVLAIGTQAGGDAIGAGLESLVGDEAAHQSAVAFDDGDVLGGLGHMAAGAAGTVGQAVEEAAGDVEQDAADLWNQATQ
jgi:hypothetical protein